MQETEELFQRNAERSANGTLTVGDSLAGFYYRLLDGPHANRVIIRSYDKIDGNPIVRFANGLTWTFLEKIQDDHCEITCPKFPDPVNKVTHVTWYPDNSDQPMHNMW